jgi:hypothetical protein
MLRYIKQFFSHPDANWKANQEFLEHFKRVTKRRSESNCNSLICSNCGAVIHKRESK